MVQINSMTAQLMYDKAKEAVLSLRNSDGSFMFDPKMMPLISQGSLRLESGMVTGQTLFQMPVLINAQTIGASSYNTEKRLNLQDLFLVTEIGVFVGKPSSSTDTQFELFTWENPLVFSTANVAASIKGFFNNGYITYDSNNRNVVTYWDLKRHYNKPINQPNTNIDYTASGLSIYGSEDGSSDGFYPVCPGWVLNGGANVKIGVNLPAALAAVEANQRLVVIPRGFLIQNATRVM